MNLDEIENPRISVLCIEADQEDRPLNATLHLLMAGTDYGHPMKA